MGVPATTGQLRTRIEDMQIGDYIICEYQANSGAVGEFRNLGTSTAPEIPVTGAVAPNGSFYLVMVDKKLGHGGLLIADRVIQHSISWDTLNAGKVIQGLPWGNVIPIMTSNTTPSGEVSASGYSSTYYPYKAFDGIKNNDNNMLLFNAVQGWLQYKFPFPKKIIKYGVTGHHNATWVSESPKDWTFEASNDGVNWVILDTVTNQTGWGAAQTRYFTINNDSYYLYYRINVTANNSGSDNYRTAISELEMFEYDIKFRSLTGGVAYADANGNSSTTDQGTGKAFPSNSEFDKYIIGFNLTKIQSGKTPFDVFHHDVVKTWTQDTPIISIAAATNRVARGGTTGLDNFSVFASSTANATVGFRPVLEFRE